jgi:hypothetical protein
VKIVEWESVLIVVEVQEEDSMSTKNPKDEASNFNGNRSIELIGSIVWITRHRPNEIKQLRQKIKEIRQQLTILESEL